MSIFRRLVGDQLHLRLNLGANETNKFVRAFGTFNNTPLFTSDLTHFGDGLYGEDIIVMPNLSHIDVKFKVYTDAGYTLLDPAYQSAYDAYEKETLDTTNFIPPMPQQVFAQFEKSKIESVIKEQAQIGVKIGASKIQALIKPDNEINSNINSNEIEGVIND